MRELAAHFVLLTFGLHTSVLSNFELLRPGPTHRGPSHGTPAGVQGKAASDAPPMASQEPLAAFDLNGWSAEGAPGPDGWRIEAAGHAADALAPDSPAFLVTTTEYSEGTFQGTMRVVAGTGSHRAGFVLGYRAPLHATGSQEHDHLLLSWNPPAPAIVGSRGEWVLSRVRSSHSQPLQVLAHVGGSPEAFGLGAPRAVTIDYSATRIRVVVAGEEVIDVHGAFPSGRFGFYASGGARARFSDFEVQPLAALAGPAPVRGPDSPNPSIAVSLTKTSLWPADHAWAGPGLKVYVTDPSGSTPSVDVTVYADEPDDQAPGDGNLWPDVDLQLDPPTFKLRRERLSARDGRVYLIHAVAHGPAGSAFDCGSVVVPLSDDAADVAAAQAQAASAVAHCEANGSAPAGYDLIAQGPFPGTSPNQRVKPIVECVIPHGGGVYTGVFGYQNDNPLAVQVPVGIDNQVTPIPADRGQPTHFLAGRSPLSEGSFAFVFSGSSHTWSLRGPDGSLRTANASSNSVPCSFTPAVPQAVDDQATTSVDTPVPIPVLVNDSDPQSQALTVSRVGAAAYGAAAINADGTVTYTPQAGFAGTDSFTYVITDGAYGWDQGTVSVTVTGAGNQPPDVDAGADQSITLPAAASLQGTVTDDGLPVGGGLAVAWSQDSGPGTATFDPTDSVTSTASFSAPGTYVLRLTGNDSQLSASDTVTVIVSAPAGPVLSIGDVVVAEGHDGSTRAVAAVTLSSPSASPVTVRYATADQTASAACDYVPTAGDITFAPGATSATVEVPVAGELVIEADETFTIALADPAGATLADATAVVTITNDDAANAPPSSPGDRTPANGLVGVAVGPTLAWTASDPDLDALTYDVYLGTSLDLAGQEWKQHCPATTGPAARYGSAHAYDDANDRLIVFGGATAAGEVADVWVLENASGLGGAPTWIPLAPAAGPGARQRAAAVYDEASNRLVVLGGCTQGCTVAAADAWVLTNANGLGGNPAWTALPDMPGARFGQAAAMVAGSGHVFVFGGSSGAQVHSSAWVLANATGGGTPAWQDVTSNGPSAREGASAAFDSTGHRVILFGGRDASDVATNDVWAFPNPHLPGSLWRSIPVEGVPPAPRWGHGSAYDETTRRLIVFHGTNAGLEAGANIAARDVSVLEEVDATTGLHRWSRVEPQNLPAPGRFLAASAYSPGRARLIAAGGRDNRATPERLDDVWTMSDPAGRLPLVSEGQTGQSFVAPTPDQGATYHWRVVARDSHGATNGAPIWRFSPNAPPTVDAGPDQSIVLGTSALLAAQVTDDGRPSGRAPFVSWTLASGPATVVFSWPDRASTTVQFVEPGTYSLRATADDGAAADSDEVTVTVEPLPTAGRTWTTTADFDEGTAVEVNTANGQLQLADQEEPFGFIWVAVSSKGTVVKIDTTTGAILGEYWTSPDGQPKDPSRTTVDRSGNVWASNRAGNSVVHIGLRENGQCVDRNGNGTIDTSTGQNDIRPWPNTGGADTNGGVSTAADECILHYTRVTAAGTRHVSVNADNDVWVSGTGTNAGAFDLLDGETGQVKRSEPSVGFGGYGGLIDANQVIWSAGPFLRWDTRLPLAGGNGGNWTGIPASSFNSYGMCIDPQGNVWNTSHNPGNAIRKFAPDGTLLGTFTHGSYYAQGCAVDDRGDVWVAHSVAGPATTVGHIKNDGTFVGNVTVGLGPTGVAVDAAGKVWATNYYSQTVSRIDPDAGPIGADGVTRIGAVDFTSVTLGGNPYNYSDMTGTMLQGAPSSGTWTTQFDSGIPSADWGYIRWNGGACGDGSILVEVSSSSDSTPGTWQPVANGDLLPVPSGRVLHLRVTLERAQTGESPLLYDVSVGTLGFEVPGGETGNQAPMVDAGVDAVAEALQQAELAGSACDDARPVTLLASAWSQVSGPGEAVFSAPDQPRTSVRFRAQGSADAALDFSGTSNPAGPWSYGWAGSPGGAFVPGVAATYFGGPSWRRGPGAPTDYPVVSGNVTPYVVTFAGVAHPPGFVHLLPANTGERAVVRWTAPSTGTYVFEGRFQGLSTLHPTSDVAIHADGAPLFAGTLSTYAQQLPFALTRTLTAGANVDFSVGYGVNLNSGNDSTGLLLSVRRETAPPAAGSYTLRLTASDSTLTSADDVTVTVTAPSCQPMPAGALGFWPGDGNARDLVGGQDATLAGNLLFGPGMVGQAYRFDGVDDTAFVATPPPLTDGSFTIAAWVQPDDQAARPLLNFGSSTVHGAHMWQGVNPTGTAPLVGALYANVVDVNTGGHIFGTPAHALIPGQWQHAALTYDRSSGVASLYRDGQRVASYQAGVFTPRTNVPLYFGQRVMTGDRYRGGLDEILMADRALNDAEIRAAYLAGSLGYCRPQPPRSDLAVTGIDLSAFQVNAQTLMASGVLSATVTNRGAGAAAASFDVTFFEDRNGNGTLETGTDVVLGVATLAGLEPGQSAVATAAASGSVLFAGNVVHAFADSGTTVAEDDETNNYASTLECETAPGPVPFAPTLKWSWTGSTVAPSSVHVIATPAVGDLNGDGWPDVVVPTFDGTYTGIVPNTSRLRAFDGRAGAELFTVTHATDNVVASSQVAIGNLDDDPLPEIVGIHTSTARVIAFEGNGDFKWISPVLSDNERWGGVSLADLDGDAVPEVVIGRHVLNRDGTLRWSGSAGRGDGPGFGALSLVADIDLDGQPEVVAGNTAYESTGTILWQKAFPDGFNAIGNFDGDAFPEIVHVAQGQVRLLDHLGNVVLGPVAIPGGGTRGGPPTVADMNGDGTPEIGVAGSSRYVVFRGDLTVLWTADTQDATSGVTGSSVFDFEGDGSAEVVYADEVKLRVYRGANGSLLFETPIGSCTAYEYPVVADVDADGRAEILAVANHTSGCPVTPNHGLYVFGGETWVPTRRIWNQHTYHITNVNDDGTIPTHEQPSWVGYNSYRQNRLTQGCEFARPDLAPSFVRRTDGPADITLTARIGNGGWRPVPAGVSVSFYDGQPGAGGTLLQAITTTDPIAAGAFADVAIVVPSTTEALPLWVVADDPAAVEESDETNNAYDSGLYITDVPNGAPTADAGPDQRLVFPQSGTVLDGTVTDDGRPVDDLDTTWGMVSGPGSATFGDASAVDTTVAFGAPGTYVLRLTADDQERTASDDITIVVEPANQAPAVDAGPDLTAATTAAAIDATVTDDGLPTGATLTYLWSQVSGPAAAGFASPNAVDTGVTFAVEGTYVFRLTASDSALVAFDDVQVTVSFQNQAPIVNAGPDQALTLPQTSLTLAGTASDDGLPPPASLTLAWVLLSGPGPVTFGAPDALQTSATFTNPGTYVIRFGATDGALTAHDDVTVVVQPGSPTGPPPTAALTSPAPGARITGPVNVGGSALSDSLASWQLEHRLKGDGPWTRFASGTSQVTNGTLGSLDATMLLNGITEVRLTVTDTAGRFASTTTHVVVKEQQKVGNFSVSFVDLEVPVSGLPIRVTRSYDSRDKRLGDFGYGWRLELSDVRVEESEAAGLAWQATVTPGYFATYCLASANPPVVTLTLPDGRVLDFQMTLTPSCQPFLPIDFARVSYVPIGATLGTLTPANGADAYVSASWPGPAQLYDAANFSLLDPSLYRYTSPDGRVFLIHDTEGLESLTDLNGNVLTVGANGITHSSGQGIAFVRDGQGRITTITDPAGRAVHYGYDANGDLVTHADRESNTTRFAYHLEFPHHLASIEDPLGRRPIRNEYDEAGRLIGHTDAFGQTITYAHQLGVRRETVVNREGEQRVLDYDERGNVLQETDPLGKVVLRTYDARNNRLTETLPHDPGAPSPPTTTYTYDGADNVLSVTDPENNRTEYTYNARKQVVTVKDPRGHFTTNAYDAKGNLTSTRASATLGGPALTETVYTYDGKGNLRTQTVVVDGVPQTSTYTYDAAGNLLVERNALDHATTYTYDPNGNRTRQTTTRTLAGGATETLETQYEYDGNGRLLKTTDPDGTFTRSVYDALGRPVESYDKLGRRTTTEYDQMGRVVLTTYADTTSEASTYDDEGRRLSFRDRRGKVTTYEYDAVGRVQKTIFPDTAAPGTVFTENTYDAAGRLTAVRDARGRTTAYEYDRSGRRTKVTVPLATGVSAETVFTYDANGNQLTVRDPLLRTTTFEYDTLNRRTKTLFPDTPQTFTETTYDALGRRRTERDQAGRVTTFGYDALGRLTSVTDARGKVTSYEYDEVGNRVAQIDANGHRTAFEYDRLGRETKRSLPGIGPAAPAFETKAYDDAGNLESRTDFAGRVTSYSYDAMNRLLGRTAQCATPPCTGAADASFTYTASGRRETVTDARGVTAYAYDDRDRLQSLTYPDGRSLAYAYDGNGNRTTLTATLPAVGGGSPTVLTTTYTYDDANRLDLVTDTAGRVYDHGYDLNGNRTSLAQPNGTLTSYVYNPLNRLTNLATTHPGLGTTIQSYALTLGPAGNRERIDEADGTSRIYTYDELYRLTSDSVTIGALNQYSKGFTYDDVGNRQSQTTTIGPVGSPGPNLTAGTLAYVYDERDRLTSETLDANPPTTYGWDDDGNLITKSGEATYAWDRENRLIRVDKADGTVVEHTYDADGVRVRTVTTPSGGSAATTNFLVDTSGSLSHVVAETNAAGVLQVHYVHGDDLLALMRPDGSGGWTSRFYHSDHIGSVRRLTDEAGQITDGYTYSAFGELLAHTGSDPQPYALTGEPYDPNVGFQYHRARWMDPRVGRFVGMDPWRGVPADPASLHRFQYVASDPVNHLDPTGASISPGEVLHNDVVLYVAADYELKHPGNLVVLPMGGAPNWEGLTPDVMDLGPAATAGGYLRNWGARRWLEIKPLSYTGWIRAQDSLIKYAALGSAVGAFPAFDWTPTNPVMVIGGRPLYIVNLSGIVFYTDSEQLYRESLLLGSVAALGQLFRMAAASSSALTEVGQIARLTALATRADSARLQGHVQLAQLTHQMAPGLP